MNRKQLFLLVVAGLLLGGLAYYQLSQRRAEFDERDAGVGKSLLGDFPANDVTQIVIKSPTGEVNLVKGEVWSVKERAGYPAAFGEISEVVRKFWDLKPAQSQKVGPSQWGRLELLPPDTKEAGTNAATLVELRGKDGKAIRSVLLGKKQMRVSGGGMGGFPVGRWLALPDNKESVFLVNETFSEVEPKAATWLNKDFFKVEKVKAITLVSTNAELSWELTRTNETADWVLSDLKAEEALDKGKVSSFSWAFSSPSFNDVHPKDAPEVKDAFTAPTSITLKTVEGFEYAVKVGAQPDPESYVLTIATTAELPKERVASAEEKPEDKEKNEKAWKEQQDKLKEKLKKEQALGGWVYQVAKWSVDSVLKDRAALLVSKSTNAAPAEFDPPPGLPGGLEGLNLNGLPKPE